MSGSMCCSFSRERSSYNFYLASVIPQNAPCEFRSGGGRSRHSNRLCHRSALCRFFRSVSQVNSETFGVVPRNRFACVGRTRHNNVADKQVPIVATKPTHRLPPVATERPVVVIVACDDAVKNSLSQVVAITGVCVDKPAAPKRKAGRAVRSDHNPPAPTDGIRGVALLNHLPPPSPRTYLQRCRRGRRSGS